ncbi:hypothetical protein BOTBODRAFT_155329 [Botryobasidium botryosum FD-172 SS1]|uniref:Peptidyl-prolyl cis-trans isomerase n=1 Tax=Botryobasidium botryosum (strain FD-172 SS1) TaxID=930990 RepID=A0A067MR29_BOTB1|nr:hypothetical protein BOTBODRAFT_155329 [Botryobasidium botryosum FD-172 SS1]
MSPWQVRMSASRSLPYFFNTDTKESSWDTPAGLTQDEIDNLPGAKEYLSDKPTKVRASHLLVKHSGSRRPSSWKEENIKRSKSEAIATLYGYSSEINGDAEKFAELATLHSDCSSHSRGGDLGFFTRGQMQKPFEEAAFALKVGQISPMVETDSGVHLILRTG